jgi:hypothetical protein
MGWLSDWFNKPSDWEIEQEARLKQIKLEYPIGTRFKSIENIPDTYYIAYPQTILIGKDSVGHVVHCWINGVDLQFNCSVTNTNGIQSGFFGQKRFFSWEDLKKYFEKID